MISKPDSKVKDPVFPHTCKLELQDKCAYKYEYNIMLIYVCVVRERERETNIFRAELQVHAVTIN
jgi:hypothetical protein